jgi:hypothetical protein
MPPDQAHASKHGYVRSRIHRGQLLEFGSRVVGAHHLPEPSL